MPTNLRLALNFLFAAIGMLIGILLGIEAGISHSCETFTNYDRILITADHVPEDEYSGYTKIYSNSETDTAVYINESYKPEVPSVGTEIYVGEDKLAGVITETGDTYVICSLEDATQISAGFSGSVVTGKLNVPLGFVSSFVGGDKIRVVLF